MSPACVVKVGGSLFGTPYWRRWLASIETSLAGHGVVVPGGGPWADAVRTAQAIEGFVVATAHRRAVRAMEAHAGEICREFGSYACVSSEEQVEAALLQGKVAVWLPHDMVVADASVPESWDMTSDSLSAWLACRLRARWLLLVKSIPHIAADLEVSELARRSWVDACFQRYCEGGGFRIRALGRDDTAELVQLAAGISSGDGKTGH